MNFKIENLGPIKRGSINLEKELIILTGPNNTGKSYVTYLIHGISQFYKIYDESLIDDDFANLFNKENSVKKLIAFSKKYSLFQGIRNKNEDFSKLTTKYIQESIKKIFLSSSINGNIDIAITDKDFDRFNDSGETIKSLRTVGNKVEVTEWSGKIHKDFFEDNSSFADPFEAAAFLIGLYTTGILEEIVDVRTFFFPAERTAINLFARHITSTKAEIKDELDADITLGLSTQKLIQRLQNDNKAAPKYPYAIRDYINFVNGFSSKEELNTDANFIDISNHIEDIIAGGKIDVDKFNKVVFTPANSTSSIELHLSSSLVKSFSYLILYLRYRAKIGDCVIIDEPEINLHPDLQISIVRVITKMINAGLKVIVSTHSDYFIKELNNLILLGELNKLEKHKSFIQQKGFTSKELVTKSQVSAYFLHDQKIDSINLEEDGLVVPTINEAIRRVDGLAEEIFIEMES